MAGEATLFDEAATDEPKRVWTAEELYELLEQRFCLPEWGLFPQATAAGMGGSHYADAMALNLFPSRGMELHGFEIKVSRNDWRRELKDPAKADALAKFCDRWWVVVSSKDLVKPGELPPTWGLLYPRSGTLYTGVQAPKNPDVKPLDRGWFAGLIRRAQAHKDLHAREAIQLATRKAERAAQERVDEQVREEVDRQLAQYRKLEEAIGIKVSDYDFQRYSGEKVGRALRMLLDGNEEGESVLKRLDWRRKELRKVLADLDRIIDGEPPDDAKEDA
jgi:hypothetical protein